MCVTVCVWVCGSSNGGRDSGHLYGYIPTYYCGMEYLGARGDIADMGQQLRWLVSEYLLISIPRSRTAK